MDPGAEQGFLTSLLLTPRASHRIRHLHRLLTPEHNGIAIRGPKTSQSGGICSATRPSAGELSSRAIALIAACFPPAPALTATEHRTARACSVLGRLSARVRR